jgi:diguanylate cyclase (GGDEF)-like protein/PAS domain S-box-containing protein
MISDGKPYLMAYFPLDISMDIRLCLQGIINHVTNVAHLCFQPAPFVITGGHQMNDSSRTKQELIEELSILKKKIKKLQLSESDHKQTEEELRKSENKYRLFADNIDDVIFILDMNLNFTYVSPSVKILMGYEPEELLKQPPIETMTPFSWDLVTKILSEELEKSEQGEISIYETLQLEMRRKDGTTVWTEVNASFIRDENHRPVSIMGVIRDITDRRRAEEALKNSEEKYRNILKNIEESYYEVDLAGNLTFFNDSMCQTMGYTREELMGMNNRGYTNKENAEKLFQAFNEIYRTGKSGSVADYEIIRKDGANRYVGTSISLRKDSSGKPIGFSGIIRDTTERKRAEEALRKSEERYRTLVEKASDIVLRTDDTGHFTFVNPAALRIMGYEEKELIGRDYLTLYRPDMREEAMKFFGLQFVKGIPNTYSEYPFIVKDGREIWLGQNIQLIVEDGHVVGFQAVARDITARRRMEEALRDSEKRYRELSIVDDLTQLYNSRHFYFQLKIELDRSNRYEQPLTLLLLDLDNFKAFNDAYGHVEGDQVLWRLGQVVKRCLRETDFAYRYGGEEFTILLPMTTSPDGAVTAERIRAELKKETFSPAPGQDVHVTVSIGLAQYKPQEEMKAFVHRVDQLMYQGKKNGKDRVCSES